MSSHTYPARSNTQSHNFDPSPGIDRLRAAYRGLNPHEALDALAVGIERRKVNWVLDADIRDFFGQLDHAWLRKFLEHRIADERVLRLIGKWLAAGVIEDGKRAEC